MTTRRTYITLSLAFALAAPAPALAAGKPPEQDRQSILAMAGDYKVRFDMRETVAFVPDYKPLEPKRSGGHEVVRVVEDRGDFISLQHLLVVEGEDKTPVIVKHWRQDWTYEPTRVVVYESAGRWTQKPVSAAQRKGAWSQTVWQTDDSPRYGGVAVTEEAQAGSVTGPKLMGLADEIAEGRIDATRASAEARALIASAEKARPLAALK